MSGAAAAELFYQQDRLVRAGAMPGRIRKTLLRKDGVQGLDGDAHRHRKQMFLSLMRTERIAALEDLSLRMQDIHVRAWEQVNDVVLYDEVRKILTKVVCEWSGVSLQEAEVKTRTAQLTALYQNAGAVGWKHLGRTSVAASCGTLGLRGCRAGTRRCP